MITSLTPEQIDLMPFVVKEWEDLLFDPNKRPIINKERVEELVCWLYEISNLKKPEVLFVSSPLGMQICANLLKDSVWSSVRSSVRSSIWNSVWNSVRDSVEDSVRDSVEDSVRSSIWNSVWNSVRSSVRNSVEDNVRHSIKDGVWNSVEDSVWNSVAISVENGVWISVEDNVRHSIKDGVWNSVWNSVRDSVRDSVGNLYFPVSLYANVGDYHWLAFYDYFERIGISFCDEFYKFKELVRSGIYDMIQLDGVCIVCELPNNIQRDDKGRLHCDTGYAISWADSYGQYYLSGVNFDEDLFKKVVSKEMSFKDVMSISNIEQRMATLKFYGSEYLLNKSDAKLINSSKRGNHLYLVEGVFDIPAYFLKYVCPSTGRVYVSGVDPNVAKKSLDADTCMAHKHNMSLEMYKILTVEA